MLVFAGIFTSIIAASLNKKETTASIHNYPPDIQEEYFRTHPRRDVSYQSNQVVLAKSLGVLMVTVILTKKVGNYLPGVKTLSKMSTENSVKWFSRYLQKKC